MIIFKALGGKAELRLVELEKNVVLVMKKVHGMCERQQNLPRLLIQRTVGSAVDAAPRFLENVEAQQSVEQMHGNEESKQEVEVTRALPSPMSCRSDTIKMRRGVSVPQ